LPKWSTINNHAHNAVHKRAMTAKLPNYGKTPNALVQRLWVMLIVPG